MTVTTVPLVKETRFPLTLVSESITWQKGDYTTGEPGRRRLKMFRGSVNSRDLVCLRIPYQLTTYPLVNGQFFWNSHPTKDGSTIKHYRYNMTRRSVESYRR